MKQRSCTGGKHYAGQLREHVLSFKNTEKKTSNQRVASAILSKLNEKQRFLLEHASISIGNMLTDLEV